VNDYLVFSPFMWVVTAESPDGVKRVFCATPTEEMAKTLVKSLDDSDTAQVYSYESVRVPILR
jgi:hypothetical protein